ncbi:TetR/AcrR family transcriptional regulator [Actinospica sp.]|jgi:AcrR family transcriptional regulator|uniref:TetR/AcrR family transcriptional regulator n=1 Tax=Actinospica sp. TaxID=1872142 RepID=UPI002C482DFD|nr:TetR/AcrR family transcriptional regulator C-terminal domain-containing protein [Actinospica sp.]HWG25073.1 TetR/AcrR family transcriptional regulator C-terminal domain-containing protein [Actinospica sp.]
MAVHTTDPRILRSRAALEETLRTLIAERELSQISVSDLTKRAGVDRSTFYEHYSGVDDLAAAACTAVFDELLAALPVPMVRPKSEKEAKANLAELFEHVAEHAALYKSLLGAHGSARVIDHLLQRMALVVHAARQRYARPTEHAEPLTDELREIPYDPFAVFVAGAIIGTIIDWLRRGRPDTPEQMAAAIWPLLHTGKAPKSHAHQPTGPNPSA